MLSRILIKVSDMIPGLKEIIIRLWRKKKCEVQGKPERFAISFLKFLFNLLLLLLNCLITLARTSYVMLKE